MKKGNVLIVGASGFAGRHLLAYLSQSQVDKNIYATFNNTTIESDDYNFKRLRLLKCDIKKYHEIERTLKMARPYEIYFLASLVTIAKSFSLILDIFNTNIMGATKFFEAVKNICPQARILVSGSAEEYGKVPPNLIPIIENTSLHPVSPYGLSKKLQQEIGFYYYKTFGLNLIFTRTFHYSGPSQPPTFVISSFAKQIVEIENKKRRFIKVGNLNAKRDFTDIRDVVRAYYLIMEKGEIGKVYNVSSNESLSIGELLNKMIHKSKSKIKIKVDPKRFRVSDVPNFVGDNTQLIKNTGWKRKYTIVQTINDVLDWWRGKLAGG